MTTEVSELIEYFASLSLPQLSTEQMCQVRAAAEKIGLEVDLTSTFMVFDYAGRDTNRKVVRFLGEIASPIGDATGEIECRLVNDDGDDTFEFYTIRQGRLYCQHAQVVRQKVRPVYDLEALKAAYTEEDAAEDLALADSDPEHVAALLAAEDAA